MQGQLNEKQTEALRVLRRWPDHWIRPKTGQGNLYCKLCDLGYAERAVKNMEVSGRIVRRAMFRLASMDTVCPKCKAETHHEDFSHGMCVNCWDAMVESSRDDNPEQEDQS